MNSTREQVGRIIDLELVNYSASIAIAQVTPGLQVTMRDDVIITTSDAFPFPDTNHACLLRATRQTADSLIAEIIDHFQSKNMPTTIFASPACAPSDLPERLLRRGFVEQRSKDAWLVLDLFNFQAPSLSTDATIERITQDQALAFAQVFLTAFEIDVDFAPSMAQFIQSGTSLPASRHYIAWLDDQAIGTCSMIRHGNFGIMGSVGVLRAHRKSGVAASLAIEAMAEAREHGVDTIIGQTTADTELERSLRASGFERVFTRTCYILQTRASHR